VQLSRVTEKLNRVTDRGRRKLNGVTNRAPEKGRQGHTFTHTEHALVATFNLSDRTNQNIQGIYYVYAGIQNIHIYIHTHTHIYIYAYYSI